MSSSISATSFDETIPQRLSLVQTGRLVATEGGLSASAVRGRAAEAAPNGACGKQGANVVEGALIPGSGGSARIGRSTFCGGEESGFRGARRPERIGRANGRLWRFSVTRVAREDPLDIIEIFPKTSERSRGSADDVPRGSSPASPVPDGIRRPRRIPERSERLDEHASAPGRATGQEKKPTARRRGQPAIWVPIRSVIDGEPLRETEGLTSSVVFGFRAGVSLVFPAPNDFEQGGRPWPGDGVRA
jgi:hypothetical protein